ncbi:hypothetical protein CMEL01_14075 [Colletotrichum melonis]|uniref:Uncharacterized protein n=1 Tax=Colletotrichum melonis TaxID=1209925 RepID=A0AAI9URN3_9PEZI|nr:hypothetical protein CMEL01_14075 [Colletotrichum melonis]
MNRSSRGPQVRNVGVRKRGEAEGSRGASPKRRCYDAGGRRASKMVRSRIVSTEPLDRFLLNGLWIPCSSRCKAGLGGPEEGKTLRARWRGRGREPSG